MDKRVFEVVRLRAMNMSSSRFKLVLVISICIRLGCLVITDATLMENS